MITLFALFTAVALIANSTSRNALLAALFGSREIETLDIAAVVPADMAASYSDNVYQVIENGFARIMWLPGYQVRNLVAYGVTVTAVVAGIEYSTR